MAIITNPTERRERAADKRRALLRFLRDELYTTPSVAALVMQCGERAARQTVASMEKAGLVRRHIVPILPGLAPITIVAVTSHGQAMAFDPGAGESVSDRTFEVGRYSLVYLAHTLDIQRLRVQAVHSGRVSKWVPGEALGVGIKGVKRPDAVVLTSDKTRVAVEVERTIKNKKRYAGILASHLTAIRQGKWSRVVWTCPDRDTAARVAAILKSIKRVSVAGHDTLLTDAHFTPFLFVAYDEFVHNL